MPATDSIKTRPVRLEVTGFVVPTQAKAFAEHKALLEGE
jgi:hypothetical protein